MVVFQASSFPALKFRRVPDGLAERHVEGSECCLIHVDDRDGKGVWVNPDVKVAYGGTADGVVNPEGGVWPGWGGRVVGVWLNRGVRVLGGLGRWIEKRKIEGRVRGWERGGGEEEKGVECLVDEMQVLVPNGWMHL
ncbi:hypothetical protein GLAREA_12054 [Glarea lozoyensis ATCC 20868]|uniref:Uncharacterized protein n=1 Tax=Glarea lozoyensis (strain ATCC 20868 / MF5171) TaxID=1116229 RepID=S3D0B9_GLAL2|nr:uncharacterized protein GLAREA_12054 [Glarea lozoyensis ATCC 20868]EPE31972.1 hypothetical protein GLAREA_12054 [Glarea lozoyensis ATCC 20868]